MQIPSLQSGAFVHRQHTIHQNTMSKALEGSSPAQKSIAQRMIPRVWRSRLRCAHSFGTSKRSRAPLATNRSSLETKDSTLSAVHEILNRMVELSTGR